MTRDEVSLRDFVDARINALDQRLTQQIHDAERSASLALAASKEERIKADDALERRLDALNEIRQALSDQNKTFVRRVEFEAHLATSTAKLDYLTSRLDQMTGQAKGFTSMWMFIVGLAGLLIAALAIYFK